MRFSLRRLMGLVTFGCVAMSAAILVGPKALDFVDAIRGVLAVILAVESIAALYAALDPWVGYPSKLDADLPRASKPRFVAGPVTLTFSILMGLAFAAMAYIGVSIVLGGGISFDGGGASTSDLLWGSGLLAASCIGAFARGACLVGFLCLMCGSPLGRRWAVPWGMCGGSLLALLVWRLTGGMQGVVTAGLAGLLMLAAGGALAWWVGRGRIFERRARRWGARAFLIGMALGAAGGMLHAVQWLLYWPPPVSLILGGLIGSGLGAVVGLLAGAVKVDASAVADEGDEMVEPGLSPFRCRSTNRTRMDADAVAWRPLHGDVCR